jgi:hypothetical protein
MNLAPEIAIPEEPSAPAITRPRGTEIEEAKFSGAKETVQQAKYPVQNRAATTMGADDRQNLNVASCVQLVSVVRRSPEHGLLLQD